MVQSVASLRGRAWCRRYFVFRLVWAMPYFPSTIYGHTELKQRAFYSKPQGRGKAKHHQLSLIFKWAVTQKSHLSASHVLCCWRESPRCSFKQRSCHDCRIVQIAGQWRQVRSPSTNSFLRNILCFRYGHAGAKWQASRVCARRFREGSAPAGSYSPCLAPNTALAATTFAGSNKVPDCSHEVGREVDTVANYV